MAQNKARGQAGATAEPNSSPFTMRSLKSFMADFLLPILYLLLLNYGILTLGWPGVGKTPSSLAWVWLWVDPPPGQSMRPEPDKVPF